MGSLNVRFLHVLGIVLVCVRASLAQPCVPDLSADANGDYVVNPLDSGFVLARFGCPVGTGDPGCDAADANDNGDVNPLDSGYILARFCGGNELPTVTVDPPPSPTSSTVITVTGTSVGATTVEIVGGVAPVIADVVACTYSADVELIQNAENNLFFTGISGDGVVGTPVAVTVIHDAQPPSLFIDFPADGAALTTETTAVAGRVSDLLSGFMGLTVTVNDLPAEVDEGIGTNGTFFLPSLLLDLGPNTVTAVATDALGNSTTTSITVERVELPEDEPSMTVLGGNGQTAMIATVLTKPIVLTMVQADGTAFENKIVTFAVTRNDGRLGATPEDALSSASLTFQTHTDANGEALAYWKLGGTAGCGNNRIEVTSNGIAGTVFFCATATPGIADQLNLGTGNNQRAEIESQAPEKLRVWVSDSCNGVGGIPVTFTVISGGGTVEGAGQVTVLSGDTGHTEVDYFLGSQTGNQITRADFEGNPGKPVTFTIFGLERSEDGTSFGGLILDNGNRPLGGAVVELYIAGALAGQTTSSEAGMFLLEDIPTSGAADVFIDADTITTMNGLPLPPDVRYPDMHYSLLIVPDAHNALPMPVLLPPLNTVNDRLYESQAIEDLELTSAGIDGLKMIIKAGTTIILADGTEISPDNPGTVTLALNQVHHDDIPMPMTDGAAPPFAWTLQPAGAHFDPPVEIEYPNMSGLPAGGIANFLSFNHATNQFEIVASGAVSSDGSTITSDLGVGITTSGWGCNCPPYSVTGNACDDGRGSGQRGPTGGPCKECGENGLENKPDGTPCNDGDPCTVERGFCVGGECSSNLLAPACMSTNVQVDHSAWTMNLNGTSRSFTVGTGSHFTGDLCIEDDTMRYFPTAMQTMEVIEIDLTGIIEPVAIPAPPRRWKRRRLPATARLHTDVLLRHNSRSG